MAKKIYTWINGLLAAIIGLIGYGCGKEPEIVCEYGVPHAELEINGQVTNEKGEALKDIQVVVHPEWNDTLYTDSLGQFDKTYKYVFPMDKQQIIVNDTSGVYASDSTTVDVTYSGGSGNWNYGRGEVHVDFQLKKN